MNKYETIENEELENYMSFLEERLDDDITKHQILAIRAYENGDETRRLKESAIVDTLKELKKEVI